MSFKPGEVIVTHDQKRHRVKKDGSLPKMRRGNRDVIGMRGFVRGALVDCLTGETQTGDWYENVITTYGHGMVVRNYAGLASSASSVAAANTSELGWARFWGIGYHTQAQSSNFSSMSIIDSLEYALHSSGGSSRATVSAGSQLLSGTWSLSQSFQYASTHISNAVTVNCIAQYHHSAVSTGAGASTAHSLATFASSTKGTTQALNVTYNWVFSTVFAFAMFATIIFMLMVLQGFFQPTGIA